MDPRFRLVYTGKLAQGADGEEIIATLVERFRLTDAKARALIRGSRRNLKHDLPLDRATRYRETLERIGLVVDIEPEGPGSRDSSFMSFDTSTDPATEDAAPPPAGPRAWIDRLPQVRRHRRIPGDRGVRRLRGGRRALPGAAGGRGAGPGSGSGRACGHPGAPWGRDLALDRRRSSWSVP